MFTRNSANRTLTTAVVAALVVTVTACGGAGGDDTERITKAQFIARADRVCEKTDALQKKAYGEYFSKRANSESSQSANERAISVIGLPLITRELKQLEELPAPEGDEKEIQAILDGIQEGIEGSEGNPALLVNPQNGGPFAPAGKLAREYGMKACALPL